MSEKTTKPDTYVKLERGDRVVWVPCVHLDTRALMDENGDLDHMEVLVRPVDGGLDGWVHANRAADADSLHPEEVELG